MGLGKCRWCDSPTFGQMECDDCKDNSIYRYHDWYDALEENSRAVRDKEGDGF